MSRQLAPVAALRLYSLQDHHWSEVCSDGGECSESVAKYRDAVWDLFQEECKYLTRQLKPLEQVSPIRELCHVMSSPSRKVESHYIPCWLEIVASVVILVNGEISEKHHCYETTYLWGIRNEVLYTKMLNWIMYMLSLIKSSVEASRAGCVTSAKCNLSHKLISLDYPAVT